jgi:putative copper export protein/methionine-rich copper-binding protein CopC
MISSRSAQRVAYPATARDVSAAPFSAILPGLVGRSVVAALAAIAIFPVSILAHDGVTRSVPAANAVVDGRLSELRLEFGRPPDLRFLSVQLTGPDSSRVSLGSPVLDGAAVRIPIAGALASGLHTIAWRVVGRDGHPVSGTIRFTCAGPPPPAPSAAPTPPPVHHDPQSFPASSSFSAESPAFVVIRFLQFIGILSIVGAIGFYYLVLGRLSNTPGDAGVSQRAQGTAAAVARVAATGLAALAALRLAAQSYAMHNEWSGIAAMQPMITGTTWGTGWLIQVAASMVVLIAFIALRGTARWAVAAIGSVALALSASLSGHAASATPTLLTVAADTLHIIGAGGWLGTLLLLMVAGIASLRAAEPASRGEIAAGMVNAFSPAALVFATIAGLTGFVAGWIHIGSIGSLFSSAYGKTLLLKLGTLSVVVLTGAYNWLRVRPALGGDESTNRLKRSATVELAAGVLVLAITAVLVATPTPMDMP